MTLRAVLRLGVRQTEELIGSIMHLLGLTLAAPDNTTLSRPAKTLEVQRRQSCKDGEPLHLLLDSTGLKLCGAGKWLVKRDQHSFKSTCVSRIWVVQSPRVKASKRERLNVGSR